MFVPKSNLLIDIGNTRVKYTWCDHTGDLSEVFVLSDWDQMKALLKQSTSVTVASVNNEDSTLRIAKLAEKLAVPHQEIKTSATYLGITCPYHNPHKLGVDRWLCALAIAIQQRRETTCQAVAVIDFGTAANCEFIVAGNYIGGWIAPGFELMRSALVAGTTKVSADNHYPESIAIGSDTQACVNAGCLAMISGMVRSAHYQLERQDNLNSSDTEIIVTGGTVDALQPLFRAENLTVRFVPDLIFQGLRLFLTHLNAYSGSPSG